MHWQLEVQYFSQGPQKIENRYWSPILIFSLIHAECVVNNDIRHQIKYIIITAHTSHMLEMVIWKILYQINDVNGQKL